MAKLSTYAGLLAGIEIGSVKPESSGGTKPVIRIPTVDVAEVRAGLGLSVADFAHRFGLTPASVGNWEAGRSEPYGVARILLAIIAAYPEVVDEVLKAPRTAIADRPGRRHRSR